MDKFTIKQLSDTFLRKFVNVQDGTSTIRIYVAKVSYNEESVWLGFHGFVPSGDGLKLGRLEVIELPIYSDRSVEVPFAYEILGDETQETLSELYL